MNCDVCGYNMKCDEGVYVGKHIALLGANPARKRVEDVFGKNEFRICHVCVLKSLGVKKKKTVKTG